ncbi:MAG TPA: hypothetical protein VFN36_06065 [Solirubrobacteraceae bacterium]|nr:hypothetical protein [Solirubrobacteraceae bacterium]
MSGSARRLPRLALVVAAVALGALEAGGSAARAAVPRGALSSLEYQRLAAAARALNRATGTRTVNWNRAATACRGTGGATGLLRAERSTCLRTIDVLRALAAFPAQERRCRAETSTTTSTTPTTTTTSSSSTATGTIPGNPALFRLMVCMEPEYEALARRAGALSAAEMVTRRTVLARGLAGRCLSTLAPTASELTSIRRFARSSGSVAADVRLIIRVTQGKEPSTAFSQARTDGDVRRFETSALAVLAARSRPMLSACPHV